ncbi:hypothetical protein P280DRAFT_47709 [Massarina eburnea CBS 473.64]|uniref:Uncharacterized protein n=1 Tax=Massarina eburnea CBS 473.64 TaxID=1395130 RepID=A0A6A6RYB2_9PLEO|nr:hypothetical protein P280DRAFT_47709 [Massarina eburnea CBS 473.64]
MATSMATRGGAPGWSPLAMPSSDAPGGCGGTGGVAPAMECDSNNSDSDSDSTVVGNGRAGGGMLLLYYYPTRLRPVVWDSGAAAPASICRCDVYVSIGVLAICLCMTACPFMVEHEAVLPAGIDTTSVTSCFSRSNRHPYSPLGATLGDNLGDTAQRCIRSSVPKPETGLIAPEMLRQTALPIVPSSALSAAVRINFNQR